MNQIKVMIIDDSEVVHILLEKVISRHQDITVIGNAYDGKDGVDQVKKLSPDIIIMDIGMPRMDGLEAIQEIMNDKPTPIIVFSSASKNMVGIGFKAIELGAVDLVEKPVSNDLSTLKEYIEEKIIKSIKTFADIKVIRRIKKTAVSLLPKETEIINENKEIEKSNKINIKINQTEGRKEKNLYKSIRSDFPIIGIAASTGGPQTLKILIDEISKRKINAGIIIIQHMADGFMQGFCDWLASYSKLPVKLPIEGEQIKPNNVYIAPGEYHLIFNKDGCFSFLDSPPIEGIKPSANLMFNSISEVYKERVIALILTGMGSDGSEGLYKVKENKGYIISQDKESSILYGMPKSAIETGLVDIVLSITEIPKYLEKICNER